MTTEAGAPQAAPEDPVAKLFIELFPSLILNVVRNPMGETILTVPPDEVPFLLRQAHEKPELSFEFLRCITATDQQKDGLELVYSLLSMKHGWTIHIKTLLPPDNPVIESITPFWPGADWHEREAREMIGIEFIGHPNPKNLLLDDDLDIHPLLKAHPLAPIELKQGYQTF
jgi:NADH:ubiquinone oxidoreductase subunit C